jgi:putative zinc binding protein
MIEVQTVRSCRSCGSGDLARVLSLGHTPLANAMPPADHTGPMPTVPLDLIRCTACSLVQLEQIVPPEVMFSYYLYFSSFSETLLSHARTLAEAVIHTKQLGPDSLVIEIASNDGYLLNFFKEHDVQVLGIEPAQNIAQVANDKGVPTIARFFGADVARELRSSACLADVLIGNNVLAHIPDLNGFVEGVRLRTSGTCSTPSSSTPFIMSTRATFR